MVVVVGGWGAVGGGGCRSPEAGGWGDERDAQRGTAPRAAEDKGGVAWG